MSVALKGIQKPSWRVPRKETHPIVACRRLPRLKLIHLHAMVHRRVPQRLPRTRGALGETIRCARSGAVRDPMAPS